MDAPPQAPARSLTPREHGAWGQLGVPLLTALALARPTLAAVAWATAAVLIFLAHEPFLVALGHRGPRALREDGARARRRLIALCAPGVILGVTGLAMAPPDARIALALPLMLGAAVTAFIFRDAERSIPGETVAAAALASTGVPVALCDGVPRASALGVWGAWLVGFALVTPAVRSVIVHARTPTPRGRRLATLAPSSLALVVLAIFAPRWCAVAATPFALASLVLVLAPPSPKHLKRVGWALVAASLTCAAALHALTPR